MKSIKDYIKLPLVERQSHLNLSEPCHERGTISSEVRGLLAYFVDTDLPRGHVAYCCHACHNANCSNPKHLYWGNPKENSKDFQDSPQFEIAKGRISKSLSGKQNPNFGIKPWNNSKAVKAHWVIAGYIFQNYFINGWDFSKYGQGPSYFSNKYSVPLGTMRTMLAMFNAGWVPLDDEEWEILKNP